jgi:glycosyltransferase involved in cell wall biosynthesis
MKQLGATVYLDGKWQWTLGLPLRFGLPFTGMSLYNVYRLADEVRLAAQMRSAVPGIYHYLYGEAGYRFCAGFAQRGGHRLLASFHLPPEKLRQRISERRHLTQLSGVVCVSKSQFAFFEEAAPRVARFHLPLGVDCDFFAPGDETSPAAPKLLCVGEHMRDWATLMAVQRRIRAAWPDATLTVVTPPDGVARQAREPGVKVTRRLSDAELRDDYRSANLLVLPLLDATASNTVLEAMACGLPVVTSDVPAMREYAGDAGIFCPRGDAEAMAEAVRALLDDTAMRREHAVRGLRRAEMFSWRRVGERLCEIYRQVMP